MPGKHVHWARTNLVHSPPTPALSFNDLSPASSAAPLTPPNSYGPMPGPSPYTVAFSNGQAPVAYSSKSPARVRLHPYLALSSGSVIDYDLMDPPSSVLDYRHRHISTRVFAESASDPPLRNLSITSSHVGWTIRVSALNGSYTTVGDVLDAIHRTLRLNVTSAEYNSLREEGRRATRAYEQRYRRLHGTQGYEQEKRGGMKRIDFLMGKTRFLGLSTTSRGPDMWHLSVT